MSDGRPDPAIYLEPEEAERQKELRMRPVHVRVVPAVRVAGFAVLIGLVALHQRFISDAFSWGELLRMAAILEGYALLAWLALALYKGRPPIRHLSLAFVFVDILVATLRDLRDRRRSELALRHPGCPAC